MKRKLQSALLSEGDPRSLFELLSQTAPIYANLFGHVLRRQAMFSQNSAGELYSWAMWFFFSSVECATWTQF